MAFEVPLEADRVDDLNFFTTLVRAPLLGTLIWIFGDKDSQNEEKSVESLSIGDSSTDTNNSSFNKTTSMKRSHSKTINLKKTPPSLTGSELSDFGEIRESFEGICLDSTISGKIKKEISWSDELGLGDIRQEFNHKSTIHEPDTSAAPVKSSLSRTRSVRSNANSLPVEHKSYPPIRHTNNLLKQSMPYTMQQRVEPFASGAGGVDSPQWGWYINTTPPTPEMYYSRPQKSRKPSSTSETSETSTSTDNSSSGMGPNPIFQNLREKNKATPVGWSGVPL